MSGATSLLRYAAIAAISPPYAMLAAMLLMILLPITVELPAAAFRQDMPLRYAFSIRLLLIFITPYFLCHDITLLSPLRCLPLLPLLRHYYIRLMKIRLCCYFIYVSIRLIFFDIFRHFRRYAFHAAYWLFSLLLRQPYWCYFFFQRCFAFLFIITRYYFSYAFFATLLLLLPCLILLRRHGVTRLFSDISPRYTPRHVTTRYAYCRLLHVTLFCLRHNIFRALFLLFAISLLSILFDFRHCYCHFDDHIRHYFAADAITPLYHYFTPFSFSMPLFSPSYAIFDISIRWFFAITLMRLLFHYYLHAYAMLAYAAMRYARVIYI